MNIIVNGEAREVKDELTLANVLHELGYRRDSVAAAVNEEFVPRSRFEETKIRDGDRVEVVAPIQGG